MLRFNVLHSALIVDDETFAGGEHEIENPTAALVRSIGSAHAAGAVEVLEGLDMSHVESQEESEAKLAAAMGNWVPPELQEDGTSAPGYWDGPWYEGHIAQAAADTAAKEADAEVEVDVTADAVGGV